MNITDVEAFMYTCRGGVQYAAEVLGQTEPDVRLAIERLQCSVTVDLFANHLKPSKDTLTEVGKVFWKYTEAFLSVVTNH
jgi:DNA-binding transcriptional LysR family regulator